jgi:hypothetical protein
LFCEAFKNLCEALFLFCGRVRIPYGGLLFLCKGLLLFYEGYKNLCKAFLLFCGSLHILCGRILLFYEEGKKLSVRAGAE